MVSHLLEYQPCNCVHDLCVLPAAVLLDLADLVVLGICVFPAAVSLDLANLVVHGLHVFPAAVCLDLADLVGGTHASMLSSRSLYLEHFGISVLST